MGKEGQERSAIGKEFQIVGAAKVNERRPFAERMSGTVRMLVKGSKVSRRSVWSKEIGQVGRLKILECFEGQRSNFEMNTLMNRKPMEFLSVGVMWW